MVVDDDADGGWLVLVPGGNGWLMSLFMIFKYGVSLLSLLG